MGTVIPTKRIEKVNKIQIVRTEKKSLKEEEIGKINV